MLSNVIRTNSYSEIYSSTAEMLTLSVCGNDFKLLYPFFLCKDFLQDHRYFNVEDKHFTIYGFNPQKADNTHIVISQDPDRFKLTESHYNNIINFFSKMPYKIGKTYFDEKNNAIIIEVNEWFQSYYLMSLFTLLFRTTMYYNNEEPLEYLKKIKKGLHAFIHVNQQKYINKSFEVIEKIFNGEKFEENYDYSPSDKVKIHNYTGIVNFAKNQ